LKLIFNDDGFSYRLLCAIGKTPYGGADIGECVSTAYRIKDGDFESWCNEWLKTARRIEEIGNQSLESGHIISAKEAYLRASNYYTEAEFYLHKDPSDDRIIQTYTKAVETFRKAANYFSHGFEAIEVPYSSNQDNETEKTTLPGFLYTVDNKAIQRPILIICTGFDGIQESLYSSNVVAALSRGYNCLTIEGPGQGREIRKQKLPFRPDWEKVVSPFIDFLLRNKGNLIDSQHIGIMGISMGGYFAPRVAAYDNRISACIANDGVIDFSKSFTQHLPPIILQALKEGNSELVNTIIQVITSFSPHATWGYTHGMWVFDAKTPFDLINKSYSYSLNKEDIQRIKCPTLVLEAEEDIYYKGQAKTLFNELICQKEHILFTKEEGAEIHCHSASLYLLNQRIFDWLDKVWKNEKEKKQP
jgi:alpha-beta hydrolase superfamily lysophospholipase